MNSDEYDEHCKKFHAERIKTAYSAWHKLLTKDCNLTEQEIDVTANALQLYLKTEVPNA